tara:strand:- start:3233 stop:4003 length:771 start_codon:yes stop_codon:yes gene_type:complete
MFKERLGLIFKDVRLGFQLAKYDFKLKNEGSYLGVLWYLLDPLLMFFIILFIRSSFLVSDVPNYPIYLLVGLIVFNFFRKTTMSSINAISGNSNLIKSINLNKEVFVISRVFQSVFSHLFEILLLIAFMIYFEISLMGLVFYPVILVLLVLFVSGISFILSILGVYVNDLNNIWSIFTRLLWFGTPIFYIVEKGTSLYRINLFNPMYYFIEGVRGVVINQMMDLLMLLIVASIGIIVLLIGLYIFEINKDKFVESL